MNVEGSTVAIGNGTASQSPPPLREGEHLSRAEFERRYSAMPDLKRAELVDNVVYVPRLDDIPHGQARADLIGWAGYYTAHTIGVDGTAHSTVRLDPNNEPQPDLCLRLPRALGSGARIGEDGFIEGPPDLVGEVVPDASNYALHAKLHAYRRNGVREYIVWRVHDHRIDWFLWRQGNYVLLPPGADGVLRSRLFPGLWLDASAAVRDEGAAVIAALHRGLATPEHAGFLTRLQEATRQSVRA